MAPPFNRVRTRAARNGDERPPVHILIACMPKSGSTFLSNMIGELPGFERAVLVPATGRREQELDGFCLSQTDALNYVAQHHVRYSKWTADMCKTHGLTPVVLVRSLFDVVVSLRDHLRHEGSHWPQFFSDGHHAELDDHALERMIVRLALPWYINFYMSWRRAPGVLLVSYDDVARDPIRTVRQVLIHAGAPASDAVVGAAVERVRRLHDNRLNIGVSGRGRELQPETVREVTGLLDFYPEAAEDLYVRALRAEAAAIVTGLAVAPPPAPAAKTGRNAARGPWARVKIEKQLVRRIIPLALAVFAIFYWCWKGDLVPDNHAYGMVDDAFVVAIAAFIAGILVRHKVSRRKRQNFRRAYVKSKAMCVPAEACANSDELVSAKFAAG